MQVINPNSASDRLWDQLGTGLQQLAQVKMNDLTKQLQRQKLEPHLGKGGVSFLQGLPPELQKVALQNPQFLMQLNQPGGQGGQGGEGGVNALNANESGMTPEKAQLLSNIFTSPKDRMAQELLQLKKESAAQKSQAHLQPFLQERFKQYEADKRIKTIAKSMLENIQKNKASFPNRFVGNLPEGAQNILIRNPHVRKYMANSNSLVKLLANSDTRGQITNAKLKLEQLAKAHVGMPIDTQEEILKEILEGVDRGERSIKQMDKLKNKETGRYPDDLRSKLAEYDIAQEDPLSFPQYYAPGSEFTDDDGTVYVNKDSKEWVPQGA